MPPISRSNSHKKSKIHHRPSMATPKNKKFKEKNSRKNIATFLDFLGFQEDHTTTVTTEFLLQKLAQIKEKQSTSVIKHSRITRVIFKFNGKVSCVIQRDPTTPNFDDQILNGGKKIGKVLLMTEEKSGDSKKYVKELENPNSDDSMVINYEDDHDGDQGIIEDHQVNNDDGDVGGFSLKDFIRNIGGSSESTVLVIEKQLTKTDVNFTQGRLLMPLSQDKYHDFLMALEKEKLNGEEDMKVRVFDPNFRESTMNLRLWKMKQQYLVLKTEWNKVVTANKFKKNTVLQVWSFRVAEELCFALVRV